MLAYFLLVPVLAVTLSSIESYTDPTFLVAILLVALIEALGIGIIAFVVMTISPLHWVTSMGLGRSAQNIIVGGMIGAILLSIPSFWGLDSNPIELWKILTQRIFSILGVGIMGAIFAKYTIIWE